MNASSRALDATEPLAAFLPRAAEPCDEPALAGVDLAARLLDQAFVHLPEHRRCGFDPLAALHALRAAPPETRGELGRRVLDVFARLGDRHTHCRLGKPFGDRVAFLPFRVAEVEEAGERRLLVAGSATPDLRTGEVLLTWQGAPSSAAIEGHAPAQLGAHRHARRAKALQTLTLRPLGILPPPRETEAVLEVEDARGRRRTVHLEWRVATAAALGPLLAPLFAPRRETLGSHGPGIAASVISTAAGTFGHLRVASFDGPPDAFVEGVLRALEAVPATGLALDLRGCEEGIVSAGERLLQLFTDETIEPQGFQFRLTPLIRRLVATCPGLASWTAAVERAAACGKTYSEPLPLTPPDAANAVGRCYRGPVVVLVDALTYSTAEMVAAGFQDHGIGPVLGTAARTGGGGGSPWSRSTIHRLSGDPLFGAPEDGTDLRVAVRRSLRVRSRAGEPLERTGVRPDHRHRPTRRDLFEEDADLMDRAGTLLARSTTRHRPVSPRLHTSRSDTAGAPGSPTAAAVEPRIG